MKNLFIVQFFKKWKQVGAIFPSSIFLVEDMLSEVDFNRAKVIVELGAGSGSFTKEILKRMTPDAKLIIFEIDSVFIEKLKKIKDSRITLVHDSAVNISKYLDNTQADYIISGIPLSNLDKEVKVDIISTSHHNLKEGGKFLQFQYFPESFHLLRQYFPEVRVRFTFFNPPPAFFYICRKY